MRAPILFILIIFGFASKVSGQVLNFPDWAELEISMVPENPLPNGFDGLWEHASDSLNERQDTLEVDILNGRNWPIEEVHIFLGHRPNPQREINSAIAWREEMENSPG